MVCVACICLIYVFCEHYFNMYALWLILMDMTSNITHLIFGYTFHMHSRTVASSAATRIYV